MDTSLAEEKYSRPWQHLPNRFLYVAVPQFYDVKDVSPASMNRL